MKTKDFINILKNKDFSPQNSKLLKKELEKYPYFTPLLYAYLISIKVNDDLNFKNELIKYSIYLTNPRTLIAQLLEIDYLKATGKLNLSETVDLQEIEKELHERAKQKHQQIVEEIIEPKIDKLRQLSQLSKQKESAPAETETIPETETKPEPKPATETKTKPESKPATETKTEIKQTQTTETTADQKKETVQATSQPKAPTEKTTEPSAEQPSTEQKITQPTEPELIQKPQPENKGKKEISQESQAASSAEEISIDDIFKKIEELKKQKLKAVSDFKKRVDTVEKLIDEQKIREEIPTPQTTKQPSTSSSQTKTTTAQPTKQTKTTADKTSSDQKQTDQTTEKQTHTQPAQAEKTEQKQAKTTEQQAEQPKTTQTTKPSTEQKSDATQTTTQQTQPTQQTTSSQTTDSGQTTKTSTAEEKKTAADRILEEIARRREMRKKKQIELIDRFLQEQPSIDRTKQPSIEGDLSEPHTKEIEIVTEKMAQIYELQGHYDKAIDIYQKLILQKPEKKDYFAQRIQELKNKTN